MLTGRQRAYTIYAHVKISDVEGAVWSWMTSCVLISTGDSLPGFDALQDETLLATTAPSNENVC